MCPHVTPRDFDRAFRIVVREIEKNSDLLNCTPGSLFSAVTDALMEGIEVGGQAKEGYLIPYGKKADYRISHRGVIKLLENTGQLLDHTARAVYEGDQFAVRFQGLETVVDHQPTGSDRSDPDKITHVYVMFKLKHKTVIECWPRERIERHRDKTSTNYNSKEAYRRSQIKDNKPVDKAKLSFWHKYFFEMSIKTLIHYCKNRGWLPRSIALDSVFEKENAMDRADFSPAETDVSNAIDGLLVHRTESDSTKPIEGDETLTQSDEMGPDETLVALREEAAEATTLDELMIIHGRYHEAFADDEYKSAVNSVLSKRKEEIRPLEQMDDDQRIKRATIAAEKATSLGEITALREKYGALSEDDGYLFDMNDIFDKREKEIREERSSESGDE